MQNDTGRRIGDLTFRDFNVAALPNLVDYKLRELRADRKAFDRMATDLLIVIGSVVAAEHGRTGVMRPTSEGDKLLCGEGYRRSAVDVRFQPSCCQVPTSQGRR
jgi:hypothetical protein